MMTLRSPLAILLAALIGYGVILGPFTSYMETKPVEEKLGYLPTTNVLKYGSADHRELLAAGLVMKVIIYFGGIAEKQAANVVSQRPDYQGMSRILFGAVQLDPYNMDAYYFAQSFLTWEVKQFKVANDLLDHGMKYRTWDWMLPFFAGFNNAYFLKDYKKAAEYYRISGDLSGSNLSKLLAGRYMQESGQTELAIAYLASMESGERNPAFKKNIQTRLSAFKEVRRIELARDLYFKQTGKMPSSIDELLKDGFLATAPQDPYGGKFYLQPDGKVASTSKFAFFQAK